MQVSIADDSHYLMFILTANFHQVCLKYAELQSTCFHCPQRFLLRSCIFFSNNRFFNSHMQHFPCIVSLFLFQCLFPIYAIIIPSKLGPSLLFSVFLFCAPLRSSNLIATLLFPSLLPPSPFSALLFLFLLIFLLSSNSFYFICPFITFLSSNPLFPFSSYPFPFFHFPLLRFGFFYSYS